jgi:hypothetical protein
MPDWLFIVIIAVLNIILGLFLKCFFPSYINKKGENLATKEDIAKITTSQENVLQEFRKDFEKFSVDVRFKRDFAFKQLTELYNLLYAVICQSEYLRHTLKLQGLKEEELLFSALPFIELSPTHKTKQTWRFENEGGTQFTQTKEIIETEMSLFNKELLCGHIIKNGTYASQKLLKLAVSYRYAYSFYSGNSAIKEKPPEEKSEQEMFYKAFPQRKVFDEEEFRLIHDIVICIIQEYNQLRKDLILEYSEIELTSGIPEAIAKQKI